MQEPGRDAEASSGDRADATPPPGVLDDIGRFGRALKQLFGAQLGLLAAELGLARAAVSWMLLAALAATVAGVGLGLSLFALAGVLLAQWFQSWVWALLVLSLLEAVFLFAMIVLFRRCMHWMTLPASRSELHATIRQAMHRAERREAGSSATDGEEGT